MDLATNRYANDWNTYSAGWDARYGSQYKNLGDEWCDDGTAQRNWERWLFAQIAEPWLSPATQALEIGPGGGKWTVRLAPRVGHLTVFDVADGMLQRTRARVEGAGLTNTSFVLGNGKDLEPIPSASVDLVFSYDVFVHIALEDTVAYVAEIARVLKDNGTVVLHHAVNDVTAAWDRIESHNDWYRQPETTLGQYYYYSQEALRRLYARQGLVIQSIWTSYCTAVVTASKPVANAVPRFEQAIRQAAIAGTQADLDAAAKAIILATTEMTDRVTSLTRGLNSGAPIHARYAVLQEMRRAVRGA